VKKTSGKKIRTSPLGEVKTQFFTFGDRNHPFVFQSGEKLDKVTLAYETYGTLSPNADNAILVFHALSGSQHAAGINHSVPEAGKLWTDEIVRGWWDDFIGPGKAIDTRSFLSSVPTISAAVTALPVQSRSTSGPRNPMGVPSPP
jgi:homoserine acetyltransferase